MAQEPPLVADAQTVVVSPNCVEVSVHVSVKKRLSVWVDTPPSLAQDPVWTTVVRLPSRVEMEKLVTVAVPGTVLVSCTVIVSAGPTGEKEADRVANTVEVVIDVTVVPEPPTVLVETRVEKMVAVPAGMVMVVCPPPTVDTTVETTVEVPDGTIFVDVDVTTLVTVSAGPTGVQLLVSVTTSVVADPTTVLYIVFVTNDVSAGPPAVKLDVKVTKSVVAGPATVLYIVEMPPLIVESFVMYEVTICSGATGVQLEVTVRNSVVAGPAAVE